MGAVFQDLGRSVKNKYSWIDLQSESTPSFASLQRLDPGSGMPSTLIRVGDQL